ncbi:hypothetical protein GALL_548260 [mine drainage metagenome]|uniref:Uncharacterized protein n=1 Tax=mine drainage metagenome TaxID=410659 RepID=A0A1J5NWN5_9ZZZZ
MGVALGLGPGRQIGVITLALHHQRGQQADVPAAPVAQQLRDNGLRTLRLDGDVAVRAILRAAFGVDQPQEVVGLGQRADGALAPAAAGALLDRHRGRNADDGFHVGPCRRLDELPCVGVDRFQIAPLALGEQHVERQGRFAGARDAGDHRHLLARDIDVDRAQIVFARLPDGDEAGLAGAQRAGEMRADGLGIVAGWSRGIDRGRPGSL